MLIFVIVFFAFIILTARSVNNSISSWQNVFSFMLVKIFVQIFFIALLLHAWVGIRDVWMDYITNTVLKLTLHILSILWLLGGLIYSIKIIWA
jgi:succinate dehydrogenase / fumarate reductase membrane anchor subunit